MEETITSLTNDIKLLDIESGTTEEQQTETSSNMNPPNPQSSFAISNLTALLNTIYAQQAQRDSALFNSINKLQGGSYKKSTIPNNQQFINLLLVKIRETVYNLKLLGIKIDGDSILIAYILLSKLDEETRKEFEDQLPTTHTIPRITHIETSL